MAHTMVRGPLHDFFAVVGSRGAWIIALQEALMNSPELTELSRKLRLLAEAFNEAATRHEPQIQAALASFQTMSQKLGDYLNQPEMRTGLGNFFDNLARAANTEEDRQRYQEMADVFRSRS